MGISDLTTQLNITMKVAIVLCVCLAVAMAQFPWDNAGQQNQHGGQHGDHMGHHDPLIELVHNEVVELVKANSGLTSAECTSKCDALFGLLEAHDEQSTDDHCKHACECDIDHNCGQHGTPPPNNQQPPQDGHQPPQDGHQPPRQP